MQSSDVVQGSGVLASAALFASTEEAESTWRDGGRSVARLRACDTVSASAKMTLAPGVYAITGGLGGLGMRAATLLTDAGASTVTLTSRNGQMPRKSCCFALPCNALFYLVASDVGDAADSCSLLSRNPPVGVLHAAGLDEPRSKQET